MTTRTQDITLVVLAVLAFAVVGPVGAGLLAHGVMPAILFDDGLLPTIYWLAWGGRVVGRITGDLICGFLLGRLRTLNPWRVLAVLLCWPVVLLAILYGFFWDADDEEWVRNVGAVGVVVQIGIQLAMMTAVIVGGIWLGRRNVATLSSHADSNRPAAA